MNTTIFAGKKVFRPMSVMLSALLTVPLLVSCGGNKSSVPPPVDDTRGATSSYPNTAPGSAPQVQQKKGLNNTQKVVLLAGAAALYYLYTHHKTAQGAGPNGQYYLSKNGRVYYRDEQHRAHWVTPPSEGIRVPVQEAQRYQDFQGYDNRPTGRDLSSLPEAQGSL